ncbi:MAG: nuclear transport factor 2 family protein [Flavobacteriales bacterium]|nr:nuclear transport factor 2 family protein [Flavobacteriales bacterium]
MINLKPPFSRKSAIAKVQNAEDAWNDKDPENVSLAYSINSHWRNRNQFFIGRPSIVDFLSNKWERELHYKLKKELWSFSDNRISVRFEYEWQHSETKQWYRTHGNEHWQFDNVGLMEIRDMSANDIEITETERRL